MRLMSEATMATNVDDVMPPGWRAPELCPLHCRCQEAADEIAKLRAALKPFAEWDESDERTHWFLSDPSPWAAAKAAYTNEQQLPKEG